MKMHRALRRVNASRRQSRRPGRRSARESAGGKTGGPPPRWKPTGHRPRGGGKRI